MILCHYVILYLRYDVIISPQAESLFKLLLPLIKDQEDKPTAPPDPEDFAEEQWLLGRLVHLLKASTPDQQYLVSTACTLMQHTQ